MALSVILTSAALCGCNKAGGADRAEAAHEREPLTIWTATDIHYLSPELTDDGELFRKVIADGDAKLTEYSQEIVDEFLREVIEANPDALPHSPQRAFVPSQARFSDRRISCIS